LDDIPVLFKAYFRNIISKHLVAIHGRRRGLQQNFYQHRPFKDKENRYTNPFTEGNPDHDPTIRAVDSTPETASFVYTYTENKTSDRLLSQRIVMCDKLIRGMLRERHHLFIDADASALSL
jgi:hypothetical protein